MQKINAKTVEDLVFKDPKVRKLLWKKYGNYFKEYLFLTQIGIDRSVIQKLCMRFLSVFTKKEDQDELIVALGGSFELEVGQRELVFAVKFNLAGFSEQLIARIKLGLKQLVEQDSVSALPGNQLKVANTSSDFSGKKHEKNVSKNSFMAPLLEQDFNLTNVHKIYPNYFLSRSKNQVRMDFWR